MTRLNYLHCLQRWGVLKCVAINWNKWIYSCIPKIKTNKMAYQGCRILLPDNEYWHRLSEEFTEENKDVGEHTCFTSLHVCLALGKWLFNSYYLTQLACAYEIKNVSHMKTRLVSPSKVWALIASSLFPFNPLSMIRTILQRLVNITTYKYLTCKMLCANVVI